MAKVVIIGISGASGAPYSVRLLEYLSRVKEVEVHLIISRLGERTIEHETKYKVADVKKFADVCYDPSDVGATLASGSFRRQGMVVVPCSMKTLSALAHSYAENLIVRAGDVTLKERKPLIVVVRETPLNLGHLRNMVQLTEMGATILPPVPSFYHKPTALEHIVDIRREGYLTSWTSNMTSTSPGREQPPPRKVQTLLVIITKQQGQRGSELTRRAKRYHI